MQRLIVLQPFLCVHFPLINEVIHSVRIKEIVDQAEERHFFLIYRCQENIIKSTL